MGGDSLFDWRLLPAFPVGEGLERFFVVAVLKMTVVWREGKTIYGNSPLCARGAFLMGGF